MKIYMLPETSDLGIGRVVEAYHRYLPAMGVQFVSEAEADLVVCHAGAHATHRQTDVLICHGLYPTHTLDKSEAYFQANADVVRNAREALAITVPSNWVAMPFKRDMTLRPHVVPHGLDVWDWPCDNDNLRYVLWGKGHTPGVCNPDVVNAIAEKLPKINFITTFGKPAHNVKVTGVLPFPKMKQTIANAGVYLATTKETFGIQTLEAMACGVPVVGYGHGATPDIVKHGITGWLVKPGDIDGLTDGIDWAVRNRRAVGLAAREHVENEFTWLVACARLYRVLEQALTIKRNNDNPPLVSVIIPCYNYGKWVGDAIQSVLNQTYKGRMEVIVVNDGSTDDTDQRIKPYLDKVTYLKKQNGGVAEARNYGIRYSNGDLIACLDADDWWKPNFLEDLVPPMLADRSLGLVYGHLESNNGQGSYVSGWPPPFDFTEQAARHNRVPSSCLYRKSAWKRALGYKAPYQPAEDAELWLRIAASGHNVRKVTDHVVYTYRLHSNSLSRTIREPDWVSDKPYHANPDAAPFAAPVSNGKASHPFKDYDDPWVSVIVPVGPGHENLVYRALDSIQAQSTMNWEAVVVNDSGKPMTHPGTGQALADAYPYIIEVRTPGSLGVAVARNLGAKAAHADMLLFLDADDWLLPGCLAYMINAYNENPCNYIYADWMGFDGKGLSPHKAKDFSIEGITREAIHPITALVPKVWHQEIGGFDESLSGWEDWAYFLELVKHKHCGIRVPTQVMVYDYSSGNRREDSLSKRNQLLPEIRSRYKERDMACGACAKKNGGSGAAGRPAARSVPARASNTRGTIAMSVKSEESDSKMVTVQENSGNIGSHGVVGVRTRINYGRKKHGDVFQMHVDDAMAQPQRYTRVASAPAQEPVPEKPAPPVDPRFDFAPEQEIKKPSVPAVPPAQVAAQQAQQAAILEQAYTPIPDDEIEVDITILPLVQIKQLELGPEDAQMALELEQSAPKPRKSVLEYLQTLIKGASDK